MNNFSIRRKPQPKHTTKVLYTRLRAKSKKEETRVSSVEDNTVAEITQEISELYEAFLYEKQQLEISCNSKIDQANDFARKKDEQRQAVKDFLLNCEGMSKEELVERLLRLV